MLNAHNKNRPVKYLECLNNGSKHWYLLKNKQVYSFIQWSTTLEMCSRKKINYTRKNMFKKKKGRKTTTLPRVQSPNIRCSVVPETKQACWHENMLALWYLHKCKCNKCVYVHAPPMQRADHIFSDKTVSQESGLMFKKWCVGDIWWIDCENRIEHHIPTKICFVSYQMTEVKNVGKISR